MNLTIISSIRQLKAKTNPNDQFREHNKLVVNSSKIDFSSHLKNYRDLKSKPLIGDNTQTIYFIMGNISTDNTSETSFWKISFDLMMKEI